jgi:hypothetical protein
VWTLWNSHCFPALVSLSRNRNIRMLEWGRIMTSLFWYPVSSWTLYLIVCHLLKCRVGSICSVGRLDFFLKLVECVINIHSFVPLHWISGDFCQQYFWTTEIMLWRITIHTHTHTHTHTTHSHPCFFYYFNQLWFLVFTLNICYHFLQVFYFNLFLPLHFNLG